MYKLAPSILAADFTKLGEEIRKIDQAGAQYIHIDVMDGMFVPSISFGIPVIEAIRKETKCIFDVHLMVEEPIRYLEAFKEAGADIITVHQEACRHLERTISKIKELQIKAGVALNPATPLCMLENILDKVDMVLIMSVNPGFGGQTFLPSSLDKLKRLRKRLSMEEKMIDIEVDGGIHLGNLEKIIDAGANIIVAGTSVFSGDIKENIKSFQGRLPHQNIFK